MQIGKVYYHGTECEETKTGTHHYEDMEDGTLWCRMCGLSIEDEYTVNQIISECDKGDSI